jgi:hypothetical protein
VTDPTSAAPDPFEDPSAATGRPTVTAVHLAAPRPEEAPVFGPYCPLTGRLLRPWWSTVLYVGFHVLSLVAIFVGTNHLHTLIHGPGVEGRSTTIFLWAGVATLVYVVGWFHARLGFVTRLVLTLGALWAIGWDWGTDRPVSFADAQLEWTLSLDQERARWDTFLEEAGAPPALVLFALLYAAAGAVVTFQTVRAVVRSWNLPERMWFARFHPVWRRRYAPDESPHPLAGILWVRDDELLTDKLIFLISRRPDAAFRFAPPLSVSRAAAIPLGALRTPVTLWRERGRFWSRAGELPERAAVLRLLFAPGGADPVSHGADGADEPPPLVVTEDPDDLPVRDLFAEDEGSLAKRYEPGFQPGELFGLLLDSRPMRREEDGAPADVPRFTALLREGDRLRVERPHPDLLGEPHLEDGRALLPWRGPDGEARTLEVDARTDSIHFVEQETAGGYHLLFLPFERVEGSGA